MKLSIKHELFARSLIAHKGNQARAYLDVYKNCSTRAAPSKASRLVRNGNISCLIFELLTGDQAIRHLAMRQIAEGLKAEKWISHKGTYVSVPDYRTRLVTAKLALKLLGDL